MSAAGDWPRTTRLLPWSLALFLVVLFLVPSEAVHFSVPLPIDPTPDRFLLAGIVLLLVVATLAGKERFAHGRPASGFTWAVLLFFLAALISIAVNAGNLAHIGDLEQAIKQVGLLACSGALFYVVAVTLRPTELKPFAMLMVALAVLMAAGTVYEYRTNTNVFYDTAADVFGPVATVASTPGTTDDGRDDNFGPAQHGLAVTSIVTLMLPFAVLGLLAARNHWRRLLYLLAIGLLFAACLATIRKTSLVAPLIALAVLAAYRPRHMLKLAPALIVIMVLIHGLAPGALGSVTQQFTDNFFTAGTTVGRTSDYEAIAPDLATYPVTGRGYGSMTVAKSDTYRILDNQYLIELLTMGFVGLAAYVFMLFSAVRLAHPLARHGLTEERRRMGLAAMAGFAAFTVSGLLYDVFSYWEVGYLFFFIAGMCSVAANAPMPVATSAPAPVAPPPARPLPVA